MIRSALLTTIVVLAGLCITRAGELPTAKPEAVGVSAAKLAELTAALPEAGRRRQDRRGSRRRSRAAARSSIACRSAIATWRARVP